jgi:hypothetical protein
LTRETYILGNAHVAFGLRWLSDICLPDLPKASDSGVPDVQLSVKSWPSINEDEAIFWYGSPACSDGFWRQVFRFSSGQFFLIRYCDGAEFLIDGSGSRIWCRWRSGASIHNVVTYLYGPVMGLLLRLHGVVCLHASVVSIEDRAVGFVGPGGAGKSTLAAALSQRGYPILADDILALRQSDGVIEALPAYPGLRLWPESVAALFGSPEALPRITAGWDKRHLQLASGRFETNRRPLAAIYFLSRSDDCPDQRVECMQGAERLRCLIANTYAYDIFDAEMRAYEFSLLSQLAGTVPLRSLSRCDELGGIGQLCDLVLNDFQDLSRLGCKAGSIAQVHV